VKSLLAIAIACAATTLSAQQLPAGAGLDVLNKR
jgi:hypothetical protein